MLFSYVSLAEVFVRLGRIGIHEELDAAWVNYAVVAVVAELDSVGLTVSEVADVAVGQIAVVEVGSVELRDDISDAWLLVDVIACHDLIVYIVYYWVETEARYRFSVVGDFAEGEGDGIVVLVFAHFYLTALALGVDVLHDALQTGEHIVEREAVPEGYKREVEAGECNAESQRLLVVCLARYTVDVIL